MSLFGSALGRTALPAQGLSRLELPTIFRTPRAASNAHPGPSRRATGTPRHAPPVAATAAAPAATATAPAPSPPATTTTTVWPCRDGQLVRIEQSVSGGGHSLRITVEGLLPDQDADLLWGVYRSSPHAWQHPESIAAPGGSQVDEASGAMRSAMHTAGRTSQTITLNVPANLAPITFAFLVALGPDPAGSALREPSKESSSEHPALPPKKQKRRYAVPLEGRHFSALLGFAPGAPTPLGPSAVAAPGAGATAGSKSRKKKSDEEGTAGVNFAVRCRGGSHVCLVLMQPPADPSNPDAAWTAVEIALDPVLNRTGDTWHASLPNLKSLNRLCYGWRVDGDVSWESGFRVQPEAVLLDPAAPAVVHLPLDPAPPLPLPCVELPDGRRVLAASAVAAAPTDAATPLPLRRPLEELRVLEIDVLTFAQGPKITHPGTFLGVAERVDHIRAVGANAVVLAPCHATARGPGSHAHHAALSLLAPDPALSTRPADPTAAAAELRDMVAALHAAGIEVIPSFDLTFTADGVDAHPTTVSLRGLDHAAYYRPNGVLNPGHPAVQALVLSAVRRWALTFGVDGFCFLNAENMAQDADGLVVDAPPLPEALAADPVLAGLKLVAAPANEGLLPRSGVRGFPHWGLWQQRNCGFTRDATALLAEGTHAALDAFAARMTGSAALFGPAWDWEEGMPGNLAVERRPAFSFNPAAAAGGPSASSLAADVTGAIGAAIFASGGGSIPSATTLAKTMITAALLAQGVPVLAEADVADVEMARFAGVVARLRRRLAHLLLPPRFDSPRDIAWHGASGGEPEWVGSTLAAAAEEGAPPPPPPAHGASYIAFCVRHPDGSAVYVGFNPHAAAVNAALPAPPPGHTWMRAVDTGRAPPEDAALDAFIEVSPAGAYTVGAKAAVVLLAGVVDHLR